MTTIPGIQVKKDTNGELTHVQVDVRQHKEAIPALQELGLLPHEEEDNEEGHSVDEFYNALVAIINEQYGTHH